MSARIIPFCHSSDDAVKIAFATHRAFVLAETVDPALRQDSAHNEAKANACRNFERLYAEWCKR